MSFHLTECFEGAVIRISGTPHAPLFCATDVCAVLDLTNVSKATETLDDDEKGITLTDTLGGVQQMLHVTESGLYHLAFKSRKAAAKRFRRWVTSEVLPAIRRTGAFHPDDARALCDGQRMTLTEWIGTLGLDLRDDARRCSDLLACVSRAASSLRWYASASKGQNRDTFFQEVPVPVLSLAEGIYIQGAVRWRTARHAGCLPVPVEVCESKPARTGGTIQEMLAQRAANPS